jgi:hypothetical protein
MYLNGVRLISAVLIAASATIGVVDKKQTPTPNSTVLSDSIESKVELVASSSAEQSAITKKAIEVDTGKIAASTSVELVIRTREQKVQIIQAFLAKHNSPMTDNAQDFVDAAEQYNLDYRLAPAIAGVESTFGKRVYPQSHNPFGWGGGYIMFDSWRDAIYTVSKGLSEKYVADGLDTPLKMQRRYAPPSSTWGAKVDFFMKKIESSADEQPTTR